MRFFCVFLIKQKKIHSVWKSTTSQQKSLGINLRKQLRSLKVHQILSHRKPGTTQQRIKDRSNFQQIRDQFNYGLNPGLLIWALVKFRIHILHKMWSSHKIWCIFLFRLKYPAACNVVKWAPPWPATAWKRCLHMNTSVIIIQLIIYSDCWIIENF